MQKSTICVIPARRGSKRLPEKNILPLHGRPLIAYSITAAIESGRFSEVYVATEDAEISRIAKAAGAEVPFLVPKELCGDLNPSHLPCQYLIDELKKKQTLGDTLVCLQPTSPLRTAKDIRDSLEKFQSQEFDFLVTVTAIDPHYFHWALSEEKNGFSKMYFGDMYMKERLLLPQVWRPNGSIKIAKLDALKKLGNFFGPRLGTYETPEERSIHVATQFELDLCEYLLKRNAK